MSRSTKYIFVTSIPYEYKVQVGRPGGVVLNLETSTASGLVFEFPLWGFSWDTTRVGIDAAHTDRSKSA